jgi:hypothetical protein
LREFPAFHCSRCRGRLCAYAGVVGLRDRFGSRHGRAQVCRRRLSRSAQGSISSSSRCLRHPSAVTSPEGCGQAGRVCTAMKSRGNSMPSDLDDRIRKPRASALGRERPTRGARNGFLASGRERNYGDRSAANQCLHASCARLERNRLIFNWSF